MKLQKGDYIELEGVSDETLEDVRDAFIRAGFTEHESLEIRRDFGYYGLDRDGETIFYNKSSNYSDSARLLTPEQVISWDKYGYGGAIIASRISTEDAKEDDWIELNGTVKPVADGVKIDVRFRSGEELKNHTSKSELRWSHEGEDGDIVAYRICEQDAKESIAVRDDKPMHELYPTYYRDVSKLVSIDYYRIADLFGITDQAAGHALKKLLLTGVRTGNKSFKKDIKEARDTLTRRLNMWDENE